MVAAHRVGIERVNVIGVRQFRTVRYRYRANGNGVRNKANIADLFQEGCCHGSKRDSRRSLPRRGTLKNIAGIIDAVLLHPDQISVAGARTCQRCIACASKFRFIDRVGGHDLFPLRPLGVTDLDGDGRTHRHAVADSANYPHLVLFECHAGTTAVPEATARKYFLYLARGYGNPRGDSFDYTYK